MKMKINALESGGTAKAVLKNKTKNSTKDPVVLSTCNKIERKIHNQYSWVIPFYRTSTTNRKQ